MEIEKFGEAGEAHHLTKEQLAQEEHAKLLLENMEATGERKEEIESRLKEIEEEIGLQEAA